jgi:hypothetical protein
MNSNVTRSMADRTLDVKPCNSSHLDSHCSSSTVNPGDTVNNVEQFNNSVQSSNASNNPLLTHVLNEPIKSWVSEAQHTMDLLFTYNKTMGDIAAQQSNTAVLFDTTVSAADDSDETALKLKRFETIAQQLFRDHVKVLDYANVCINEERALQERVETLVTRLESTEQMLKNERDGKLMLNRKHEEIESVYQDELTKMDAKLQTLENKLAKLNTENRHLMSYKEDMHSELADQLEELGRQKYRLETVNRTLSSNREQVEGEAIECKMKLKEWQEHSYVFLMLIMRFGQFKRLWTLFFDSVQTSLNSTRFAAGRSSIKDFPLDGLRMLNLILESKLACSSDSGSTPSRSSSDKSPRSRANESDGESSVDSTDRTCLMVKPEETTYSSDPDVSSDPSDLVRKQLWQQIADSYLDDAIVKLLVQFAVQAQCKSVPAKSSKRSRIYRKRMIQNGLLLHPTIATNSDQSFASRSSPANSSFGGDITHEILNPFEESLCGQVAKAIAHNRDTSGENLLDILQSDRPINFDESCSNTSAYEEHDEDDDDCDTDDEAGPSNRAPKMDQTRTIKSKEASSACAALPIITVTQHDIDGSKEIGSRNNAAPVELPVVPMNSEIEIMNESQHIKDMLSAKDIDSRRSVSQIGVNVTVSPTILTFMRNRYFLLLEYIPWVLCIFIALMHFLPLVFRLIGRVWWNNIDNISRFVSAFVTLEYINDA